jgi:PAS domain S-box-containing protein
MKLECLEDADLALKTVKQLTSLAETNDMSTLIDGSEGTGIARAFLDAFMNSKDRLISLERAVESSRNGIVITDPRLPDNPIVYVNKGFLELTGYGLDEILGQNCRFLQGMDRNQPEIQLIREAIAQGRPCLTLLRNYKKDGTLFWNELSLSPVYDADGVLINYIGVQDDVTARKEAERRVADFYSMVSHELRTPLSSIRASLGLVADGDAGAVSQQSERLINIALSNANRLLKLVDDILDMKRIEAGQLKLDLGLVQPDELVNDVVHSLNDLAAESKVTLTSTIDTKKAFCADGVRINQVLVNLIANAIKFSPPSTTVAIAVRQQNGGMHFEVKDQGPGISEADKSKLFLKFQQLDSSETRAQPGSGLGLAISKLIVEMHGGTIGLDSTIGGGSTFWFTLPMVAS